MILFDAASLDKSIAQSVRRSVCRSVGNIFGFANGFRMTVLFVRMEKDLKDSESNLGMI